MFDFLLSPANTPFTVALGLMITFTVIEIITASMGMGLSDMIDSLLPEFDADIDLDIDGADASGPDSVTKLLAWFRIGEVPVVMLLIVFLTGFGLSGLIFQYLAASILQTAMPVGIAAFVALAASIPIVRVCGGALGKFMPKDETYAVSEKSFHGKVVTITLGQARAGKPAQAKLTDQYGQTHYMMVEPDKDDEQFGQGNKAIIVGQAGATYKVISCTSAALTD